MSMQIENAEQLPVHSYRVPGKASVLLTDDVAFKVFVAELQKDLENDLQNYDIEDKTTLKKYYGPLMQIATWSNATTTRCPICRR